MIYVLMICCVSYLKQARWPRYVQAASMETWSVASSRLRYVLSAYIQLSGDIWRSRTFGDGQVVAFEDFKRLSAGTSLAEVKVLVPFQVYEKLFCMSVALLNDVVRLLESGVRRAKAMKCRTVHTLKAA